MLFHRSRSLNIVLAIIGLMCTTTLAEEGPNPFESLAGPRIVHRGLSPRNPIDALIRRFGFGCSYGFSAKWNRNRCSLERHIAEFLRELSGDRASVSIKLKKLGVDCGEISKRTFCTYQRIVETTAYFDGAAVNTNYDLFTVEIWIGEDGVEMPFDVIVTRHMFDLKHLDPDPPKLPI